MLINCPRSRLQRASASGALILGIVSLVAGGRVLLGMGDPGYHVVRPVLVFNTAMGIVYALVGAVIHRSAAYGRRGSAWIVAANLAVLATLVVYAQRGGEVARETFAAMSFRTLFWVVVYLALSAAVRRERPAA